MPATRSVQTGASSPPGSTSGSSSWWPRPWAWSLSRPESLRAAGCGPSVTGYLTLVIGFQWTHTALLEGFGASAGKRLCGLLVVAGQDGGPVGIVRAVLRRAVLDACLGGRAWLAFVLTGLRQFADPWPVGRFGGLADYVVLLVFWAALLLPFFL